MATFTVLYDACMLYPAPLRDLLMHLAETDMFCARWTNAIHDEWIRSLLATRPELRARLERTRDLMNRSVPDCLITDYEDLIESLTLPDAKDRHVLAVAIKGRVDVIVTYNLRDFPATVLEQYNIEAAHPDQFIKGQLNLEPGAVCAAIKRLRGALKKPVVTAEELLATYQRQSLSQTVAHLRNFIELL